MQVANTDEEQLDLVEFKAVLWNKSQFKTQNPMEVDDTEVPIVLIQIQKRWTNLAKRLQLGYHDG